MWIFQKLSDGTTKYLISGNKLYTIGRKNCDFILENDASISRKHCSIHVAKQNECPFSVNTITGVWIVDEQSKYGSYLKDKNDWVKINSNENKKLTNGSVIKFGLMDNIWSLEFKPIVACASGISADQKKKIESTLQLIDGVWRNAWCKECSLVIVNEITLTVKVVLALINGIPIVTPGYLEKAVESIKNQTPLPKFEDYRPIIKESILDKNLVSLDTKNQRKELFKDIKFVIPTKKQFDTLKEVILSAGGGIELLSPGGKLERFSEDNVIVIQLPLNNTGIPENLCKSFKEISVFLKNHGRRTVPESEIAQAVAYSSTEKFCNPISTCFNLRIGESKQVDLGPVIVEETPITAEIDTKFSGCGVVPSSATMDTETPIERTSELEYPPVPITLDSELNLSNLQKSERKRTHSPNPIDHDFQKKKARNKSHLNGDDNSVDNKKPETNNRTGGKSISNKSNENKGPLITNYFQKQSNPPAEKPPQMFRQASTGFWDCDVVSVKSCKRTMSTESDDSAGDSSFSRKKTKLLEPKASKPTTPNLDTPHKVVETLQPNENSTDSFPPIRKNFMEEEDDRTGYFGREETSDFDIQVDDLNNTIFSLTIISPAFMKEDGTLKDPPSEPVNVKRFRKQKIISSAILQTLEEQDDALSDGEWIEPHSGRFNISVADGNDW